MVASRDYAKEFLGIINKSSGKHSTYQLFRDFVGLSSRSISNQRFLYNQKLEDEYLDIAKKYSKEELSRMGELLALTFMALSQRSYDFLGHCYMSLGLGNERAGQFFTPYHVCQFMARINYLDKLPDTGYFSVQDPAVGSGGMLIAYAENLQNQGYKLEEQLLCSGIDIDALVAEMAYIQLSILNVPAEIYVGDSLSGKYSRVYYTPAYITFSHAQKTSHKPINDSTQENINTVLAEPQIDSTKVAKPIVEDTKRKAKTNVPQLSLF